MTAASDRIVRAAIAFVDAINSDAQISAVAEQATGEWVELADAVIMRRVADSGRDSQPTGPSSNERSPTQNEWNELDARLTKVYSLLCGGTPGEIREARDRLLDAQNLRAEMAIASRRSAGETPREPDVCPHCGCREQITTPSGPCARCKRPWTDPPVPLLRDDERLLCMLAGHLCELDGVDEPDQLIWEGQPPEPWGPVWMRYQPKAKDILALIDETLHPKAEAPNETGCSGWQPIETAPAEGNFMVAIEGLPHLPWPAHAGDGRIYSNAHGLLNELNESHRVTRATHWMPLPPPAPQVKTTPESSGKIMKEPQ